MVAIALKSARPEVLREVEGPSPALRALWNFVNGI
jgi:hypothetical protein